MNQSQNEVLRKAFLEAQMRRLNDIEARAPSDVAFSPAFEQKMEKLIRRQKRWYWNYTNTPGERACAVLVSLVLVLSMCLSVSALREAIGNFFVDVYDSFVRIFPNDTSDDAPESIEIVYTFASLPDGYVMTEQIVTNIYAKTKWNQGEKEILLIQNPIFEDMFVDADIEVDQAEIITLGEWSVYYTAEHQNRNFIWVTNEYLYRLKCSESIELEMALDMIADMIPQD